MRALVGPLAGFLTMLGGLYYLAFTQVTNVFVDPRRTELVQNDTVADPTHVIVASFLLVVGLCVLARSFTPAQGNLRAVAVGVLGVSSFLLLVLHLTLYVNAVSVGTEDMLASRFTASYLFHTGDLYTLLPVFLLFLLTLILLAGFVGSLAFLIAPQRFRRALWDSRDWEKTEAHLVATSLLLVVGLSVFLVFMVRLARALDEERPTGPSLFSQNLATTYYLQAFFLGLLILTIAARVFLINWGTSLLRDADTLRDSFDNVGRLERVLIGIVLLFNVLVLLGPREAASEVLSRDPVFLLDTRGFAWFFFFMAVPYVPYAWSLRRLRDLAETRTTPGLPFSTRSLRLVLTTLVGLVLLTAIGSAANWSAVGLMASYAGFMAVVLAVFSISLHLDRGLIEPSFRDSASPPLFFGSVLFALATGLMMWGAGNTFEVTYQVQGQALSPDNLSPYGADLFYRLGGAILLSLTPMLALAVAKNAMGSKKSLVGPYVLGFASLLLLGLTVFTVGVWHAAGGGTDAFAGFAFHQYYAEEKLIVTGVVLATGVALFWSLGRIVLAIVRGRAGFVLQAAKPLPTFRRVE